MAVNRDFLLVLKSNGLGDGELDLGEKLMKTFLSVLYESGDYPARIICMNHGVFLTTDGSPVSDLMGRFEEQGTEILSCGTCLEYYGRSDRLVVGKPGNMKDTVNSMLNYERVVTP